MYMLLTIEGAQPAEEVNNKRIRTVVSFWGGLRRKERQKMLSYYSGFFKIPPYTIIYILIYIF